MSNEEFLDRQQSDASLETVSWVPFSIDGDPCHALTCYHNETSVVMGLLSKGEDDNGDEMYVFRFYADEAGEEDDMCMLVHDNADLLKKQIEIMVKCGTVQGRVASDELAQAMRRSRQ